MSEPLRTESEIAAPLTDADREARIEQLLLSGLDQYFAGKYEQAIDIWTRVAFLERGHGRARAYIERARSALAERQREGEELLHTGVAAYNAGDLPAARELLTRAVEQGGSDTAQIFLQRVSRLEAASQAARVEPAGRTAASVAADASPARTRRPLAVAVLVAATASVVLGAVPLASWLTQLPVASSSPTPSQVEALPIVRVPEMRLARARELYANGQLRDALRVLDEIEHTDPLRQQADRLRADVQRALFAGAPPLSDTGERAR